MVKKTVSAAENIVLLCPNILKDNKIFTTFIALAIVGSIFGFLLGMIIHT